LAWELCEAAYDAIDTKAYAFDKRMWDAVAVRVIQKRDRLLAAGEIPWDKNLKGTGLADWVLAHNARLLAAWDPPAGTP
jgi:hypothetical protein